MGVGVVPHAPVLVPEIGGARLPAVEDTRRAMKTLAGQLAAADPRTVVIISPHGDVDRSAIGLAGVPRLEGDFGAFGRPDLSFSADNDVVLVRALAREAEGAGLPVWLRAGPGSTGGSRLSYAFLVPWYYLVEAGIRARVVAVTMARLGPDRLHRFGELVARAAAQTATRVAVLASADLSHRLTHDAPAGYHPDGAVFDRTVMAALAAGRPACVLGIDPELAERAGECGWRPILMALGALAGTSFRSRVFSYEGPFGVGYGVALLTPGPDFAGLARTALATHLGEGRTMTSPEALGEPTGVYVTIKRQGELRGCMGTTEPAAADRASAVIASAIRAGTADPRFPPVTLEELDGLDFSVDILGELEEVTGPDDFDPQRYGLVVRRGSRSGLLLPALEGIDTAEEQLRLVLDKAGLRDRSGVRLYRFTSERYHSPVPGRECSR